MNKLLRPRAVISVAVALITIALVAGVALQTRIRYSADVAPDDATGFTTNVTNSSNQPAFATPLAEIVAEQATRSVSTVAYNPLVKDAGSTSTCPVSVRDLDIKQIESAIGNFLSDFYGIDDSGCVKLTVDVKWSYRFYYTYNPDRRFIKIHIYGNVTKSYLDDKCQLYTDPPDKFDIWITFEITPNGLVNVGPNPPKGAKICAIIIQGGHKVFTFGSIDPAKCPKCKPTPVPAIDNTIPGAT